MLACANSPARLQALRRKVLAVFATAALPLRPSHAQDAPAADTTRLEGLWGGELTHKGERTEIYVQFARGDDGALRARFSLPVLHLYEVPLGKVTSTGTTLRFASLAFEYDAQADRLRGTLPPDIAPVYTLATVLTRRARLERRPRPDFDAPVRSPVWTAELGAPIWCDIAVANDLVFAGGDDGRLHAVETRTGKPRWVYGAAGPLRSGPTIAGDRLYVTSDDGVLHCIDARTAKAHWLVRVNRAPANRLPASDPKSKFDLHGAAVAVARNALFVATHEGRVLALDPANGSPRWSFAAGDRFLAAPFVSNERVFVGCYDGKVYALDAASGALRWAFDAKAPVTSTPVAAHGVVVVGSRGYDLWGLDARTGRPRWNRYVWFSWIESTVAVAGPSGYVGSSDGAKVFAFDVISGSPHWTADVHGLAWGTPAVTGERVFIGTRGETGAIAHRAHALALDRASGKVLWRYPFPASDPRAPHGFAGSPALADDRAYLASLDGRMHAFDAR